MVVMILGNAPAGVRGELTRWLIEPHPGVFVGHVNAMVRDRLWDKCCKARHIGGVVQIWTTNNEQHFEIRMFGETKRQVVNFDGLQLIRVPQVSPAEEGKERSTPEAGRASGAFCRRAPPISGSFATDDRNI